MKKFCFFCLLQIVCLFDHLSPFLFFNTKKLYSQTLLFLGCGQTKTRII